MAIEQNLNTIRKAALGRQVRTAIADAIEECYNDGKAGAVDLQARQEINRLSPLAGGPLIALTKAAMTDTSKAYLYTGSESGMTPGNWYYHNGTAWVSGGEYGVIADPGVLQVTDEYGSVYPDYDAKAANLAAARETPIYTYCFGDYDSGCWTGSDAALVKQTTGSNTSRHPIPYDTSMTVKIGQLPTGNVLHIFFGRMEGGTFVPVHRVNYSSNSPRLSMRIFKGYAQEIGDCVMAFGCVNNTVVLDDVLTVTVRSPITEMYPTQTMTLVNSNVYRYVKDDRDIVWYYSDAVEGYDQGYHSALGKKWLYANGLPIDAAFYRTGTAGEIICIQEPVGDLGAPQSGVEYPQLIKIPEGCDNYSMAVYGVLAPSSSTMKNLGLTLLEFMPYIASWSKVRHAPVPSRAAGKAIANALKITNFTYPVTRLVMRYHKLIFDRTTINSQRVEAEAKGFPYGTNSPGYDNSFYSYLSAVRLIAGVQSAALTGSNNRYGYVCVAFLSMVLGLDMNEGAEWWLQNWRDVMEPITPGTVCDVGDIIIMTDYDEGLKKTPPWPKWLFTHGGLVVDKLWEEETGAFLGYVIAESTNCWTRLYLKKTLYESSNARRLWRMRIQSSDIPAITSKYRYGVDRLYDTLNHPNDIPFPAVASYYGDRVLLGDDITGMEASYCKKNWTLFFDKPFTTGTVELPSGAVRTFAVSDLDGYSDLDTYAVGRMTAFFAEGGYGVYSIKMDGSDAPPATFRYFAPPEISYNEAQTVINCARAEDWDEIWLRVMPVSGAGTEEETPYANYVWIKAEFENGSYTIPSKYARCVRVKLVDNEFGAVTYRISDDWHLADGSEAPYPDPEEEPSDPGETPTTDSEDPLVLDNGQTLAQIVAELEARVAALEAVT